jgi:hypothetical protein
VELSNQKLKVLVVPADRSVPVRLRSLAPSRFDAELGGRPQHVLPLNSAPPVDWMLFVAADGGDPRANLRAQLLCTHLGGSPGMTLKGAVVFTGRTAGVRVRSVPGIFPQVARLLGMQVSAVE